MSTTHIDTNARPRSTLPGQGQVADILNKEICGAENVIGKLRWLGNGDRFAATPMADTHQLLYLLEGEGVITLENKSYAVKKGAGIYLGPAETASIAQAGGAQLKLFHLIVPKVADR